MITRLLALRLFEAFSIQRWNDLIKPVDMIEMDKQAYKAILTYFFAKAEEREGEVIDWEYMVYGSLFSLLKNIVMSNIKAPVIKRIMEEHPEEYRELNKWIVQQWDGIILDDSILDRFEKFLLDDDNNINLKIIRAAHKYSTFREFELIKEVNTAYPILNEYKKEVTEGLEKYNDLFGVKEIFTKKGDLYEAICMIEQLRYQRRWNQTQRIPMTSVLGHSMFVACLMIFITKHLNPCTSRLKNNFFASLLHDLPETVVGDIISPVKRATTMFPEIVKRIEAEICESVLYPRIPEYILEEIKYYVGDGLDKEGEFLNRIIIKGKVSAIDEEEKMEKYNNEECSPIDGRLIKAADDIAAFIEADQSISHGVTSRHLRDGMGYIRQKYLNELAIINGIQISKFYLEFV